MARAGRTPPVGRLKRRPEFLAVAGTRRKWVAPGLILQVRAHDARQHPGEGEPTVRIGLTASRKVGNAVVRNRARRRLRALATALLADHAEPGHDFVLIARTETATRPFADLTGDLTKGLRRLGLWRDGATGDAAAAGDAVQAGGVMPQRGAP